MAAMAVALPGREEPVYRILWAMVAIAAIADRFQPLRRIPPSEGIPDGRTPNPA